MNLSFFFLLLSWHSLLSSLAFVDTCLTISGDLLLVCPFWYFQASKRPFSLLLTFTYRNYIWIISVIKLIRFFFFSSAFIPHWLNLTRTKNWKILPITSSQILLTRALGETRLLNLLNFLFCCPWSAARDVCCLISPSSLTFFGFTTATLRC